MHGCCRDGQHGSSCNVALNPVPNRSTCSGSLCVPAASLLNAPTSASTDTLHSPVDGSKSYCSNFPNPCNSKRLVTTLSRPEIWVPCHLRDTQPHRKNHCTYSGTAKGGLISTGWRQNHAPGSCWTTSTVVNRHHGMASIYRHPFRFASCRSVGWLRPDRM